MNSVAASPIADLAQSIRNDIESVNHRERVIVEVSRLTRLEMTLTKLLEQLSAEATVASAARAAGIDLVVGNLAVALDGAKSAQSSVSRGEPDLDEVERLQQEIRNELSGVQSSITIAWRELVDRRVPGQEGLMNLVDTFREIDGAGELANELRQLVADVRSLGRGSPSPTALQQLESHAARLPEVLQSLVGDDPTVRAFANGVARGGAPVGGLTPAVLEWMDSKGFESSFKIVAGRPVGG